MSLCSRAIRDHVAAVIACGLFLSPVATMVAAPQAAAAIKAPRPIDGGWPKSYVTPNGARVILYQPQIADWKDEKHLTLYAAVSYTPAGATTPVLGTVTAAAQTKVSVSQRLVDFSVFEITDSNFPTLDKGQMSALLAEIVKAIPQQERVIALDRVLAGIDKSRIIAKKTGDLKADPPAVFYSTRPAVMVNIDGAPVWGAIAGTDLEYAINTNWDLFRHGPTSTLYLRDGTFWLKATMIAGPWTPAGVLPASFGQLPLNDNWLAVTSQLPGAPVAAANAPSVFVSPRPAELILLRGIPAYQPINGTSLLWVNNTDSDVFRVGTAGPIYYLVAGRWFSAPDFLGPWTFATPTLPDDFRKIPLEHPRSRVLASVPGTPQAAEAVLIADIPQRARVSRTLAAPTVAYQGQPDFQPIESTVSRAVNTDKDVFEVDTIYYMCFQGVWFIAEAPAGPWSVTDAVPKAIYRIPPSSPAYNVTFVTVEQDSDPKWVEFAAASAYSGVMIGWGCAVWGSGYYYPPYIGMAGGLPVYFPHYPTYGYSAWYNPWTGSFGRGAAVYGPYGGAGVGARYNPVTGTYARGAAAWGPYGGAAAGQRDNARTGTYARGGVAYGPYGARGAAEAYNPRTGAFSATRQGTGVYGSWGSTSVQRGDQWASTSHVTNNPTGATTRTMQGSQGGAAATRTGPVGTSGVARTSSGDMYAGRDGNVYRNQGGSWQKYDSGGWSTLERPAALSSLQGLSGADRFGGFDSSTVGQLNRDSFARADGMQRADSWNTIRSGNGFGGGSFRPTGGGFGGGGFRGGGRR